MYHIDKKYIIAGCVAFLVFLVIFNLEVKVHHPQQNANNVAIHPSTAKQVSLSPPIPDNNYMSPEARLRKQLDDYGLPDTDEYMSQSLQEQLNQLHNKFYYDNCRYAPMV